MVAELKMAEIAKRINAHLKRFEADPVINARSESLLGGNGLSGLSRFYQAGAFYERGAKLSVVYVSYQGSTAISKQQALTYLEWLDAGNVGRHFEAIRKPGKKRG
jgi:hypothetical protein